MAEQNPSLCTANKWSPSSSEMETFVEQRDTTLRIQTTKEDATKVKPLLIVDLNDDCLAEVFEYLNFEDLNDIFKTNIRFENGARMAFAFKFANSVYTVATRSYDGRQQPDFLTRFGGVITKLIVVYRPNTKFPRENAELHKKVFESCYGSLREIEFQEFNSSIFKGIDVAAEHSFGKVTKVRFNIGILEGFLPNFKAWFPNAQSLELENVGFRNEVEAALIEQHFPSLKHMAVINAPNGTFNDNVSIATAVLLSNKNLVNAIKLNPQLSSLKVMHNNDASLHGQKIEINDDLLTTINEKLPQLESLHLTFASLEISRMTAGTEIHFSGLKMLFVEFVSSDILKDLMVSAGQLEHLALKSKAKIQNDTNVAPFIARFPNVNKISIQGGLELTLASLIDLSGLREIDFVDEDIDLPDSFYSDLRELLSIGLSSMHFFDQIFFPHTRIVSLLAEIPNLEKLRIEKRHDLSFGEKLREICVQQFRKIVQDSRICKANWKVSIAYDDNYLEAIYEKQPAAN